MTVYFYIFYNFINKIEQLYWSQNIVRVTCDAGALNHIYSVCVVFHYNWETRCCSVYNDDAYIYVRSVPRFLSDCMCNVNE